MNEKLKIVALLGFTDSVIGDLTKGKRKIAERQFEKLVHKLGVNFDYCEEDINKIFE